jgi:hypothetical protein
MKIKLYNCDASIDFNHSEISSITFSQITPFYDSIQPDDSYVEVAGTYSCDS